MNRRPLCVLWIGLMLAIWICRTAGLPIFGEPSLTAEERAALDRGITAGITGRVAARSVRERTILYTLKDVVIRFDDRSLGFSKLLLTAADAADL